MIIRNHKPLAAISFDTKTFKILERFLCDEDSTIKLTRVDPESFFNKLDSTYQYVNLITKDFTLRKQVSEALDANLLDRFSYINYDWATHKNTEFGPGSVIYPGLISYYAKIGKDTMIHGRVSLAEDVKIGNGCFMSGLITIAGSTTLGNYCFVSTGVTIMDGLKIADEVKLLPSMTIKKSINKSGTYYNPHVFDIKEFSPIKAKND